MRPDLNSAGAAPVASPTVTAPTVTAGSSLDQVARWCPFVVTHVDGDDTLARRLRAAGLWPGAHVALIGLAPFGDPLLFRVHGFRLALRRSEARRVLVVRAPGPPPEATA